MSFKTLFPRAFKRNLYCGKYSQDKHTLNPGYNYNMEYKTKTYKYCIVPMCKNTSVNAQDKRFICLPSDKNRRILWQKAMGRKELLSFKGTKYCCEDHFNLEVDMENYIKFRLMGNVFIKMKPHVVPHKFECQEKYDVEESQAVEFKKGLLKKSRPKLLGKNLSLNDFKAAVVIKDELEIEETNLINDNTYVRCEQFHNNIKSETEEEKTLETCYDEHIWGEVNEDNSIFEENILNTHTLVKIENHNGSSDEIDVPECDTNIKNQSMKRSIHAVHQKKRKRKHEHDSSHPISTSISKQTVTNLKNIFISDLTTDEKLAVKKAGRPLPEINLEQLTKSRNRTYKRTFNYSIYLKNDWLCGCEVTNRLYCFPCLLFACNSGTSWVTMGMGDLSHLSQKIKQHETSRAHMEAQIEIKLLGKQDILQQLDNVYRMNIREHNDKVKLNRYTLSKIIDAIKFCGAFELALRGHEETQASMNPEMFKGLINYTVELESALKEHFEKATVFKGTSEIVQNQLLDCMLQVCQEQIKDEIAQAKYVSVIVDETTDVSNAFQSVAVFRYLLPNGSPIERFWGFFNPVNQSAVDLSDGLKQILDHVMERDKEKLISQSYDGASAHGGVHTVIQRDYKYSFYVHCYAHQLNLILAQAASQNTEARIFFANLSDITNFFTNSPQRVAMLDEIIGRVPYASNGRWNFKSETVSTVYMNRLILIECMETIKTTAKQTIIINQACALSRMLQDPQFVFWLAVFHRIMPHSHNLYNQLQLLRTDPVELHKSLEAFEENIQIERDNLETVIQEIEVVDLLPTNKRDEDPYITQITAAKNVCNSIVFQIKERFSFRNHLMAANLFYSENFRKYDKKIPNEYLAATVQAFKFLDQAKLKLELEVIYRRTDFRMCGPLNFLKFIIENSMESIFSETCKLLRILITIPMRSGEAERSFSTLERIKTFLRSSMTEEKLKLNALAMLALEKDLNRDLLDFNERVISKFAEEKDQGFELVYKHFD